jgi:hypothetical protein
LREEVKPVAVSRGVVSPASVENLKELTRQQVARGAERAPNVLREIMEDPEAPHAVRANVAMFFINHAIGKPVEHKKTEHSIPQIGFNVLNFADSQVAREYVEAQSRVLEDE